MDRKTIIEKYSYYYDILQKLGGYPLSSEVTIMGGEGGERLNPSRGVIQAAYKEIKKYKFNGNLIDYLCWISTLYLLDMAKRNVSADKDPKAYYAKLYSRYIVRNYKSFTYDANNLLRLFIKKPAYYFNWIHEDENIKDGREVDGKNPSILYHDGDVEEYIFLAGFRFVLYQKESLGQVEVDLLLERYLRFGFLDGIMEDEKLEKAPYSENSPDKLNEVIA